MAELKVVLLAVKSVVLMVDAKVEKLAVLMALLMVDNSEILMVEM